MCNTLNLSTPRVGPSRNLSSRTSTRPQKWQILKNILILSLSLMLLLTSSSIIVVMQATINPTHLSEEYAFLFLMHLCLCLSYLFLNLLVLRCCGCKWSLVVGFGCFMPFIAANMYPMYWTIFPTTLLLSIGFGIILSAKSTYISAIARIYADMEDESRDVIIVRFHAIVYTFMFISALAGNLIIAAVFTMKSNLDPMAISFFEAEEYCGAEYCPKPVPQMSPMLKRPDEYRLNVLAGVSFSLIWLATILVALGVSPLKIFNLPQKEYFSSNLSIKACVYGAAKQIFDPYQLLLTPLSIYVGVQGTLMSVDFPTAYVSCGWTQDAVSTILITTGIIAVMSTASVAFLAKVVTRNKILAFSSIMVLITYAILIILRPTASSSYAFYLVGPLAALGEVPMLIILQAFIGINYPNDLGITYCSWAFVHNVGLLVGYLLSVNFCLIVKIYVSASLLVVGLCGYALIEFIEKRKLQKSLDDIELK